MVAFQALQYHARAVRVTSGLLKSQTLPGTVCHVRIPVPKLGTDNQVMSQGVWPAAQGERVGILDGPGTPGAE